MPEARGTWPPVNLIRVSQSIYSLPELLSRAPAASTGIKACPPLLKQEPYNGLESLDTFLMKFCRMANYLRWDKEDTFHHICASLQGVAGQVLWDLGPRATTAGIVCVLQTKFGTQLQAEHFKAKLRVRRRAPGDDIRRLVMVAYPSADEALTNHIGKEALSLH